MKCDGRNPTINEVKRAFLSFMNSLANKKAGKTIKDAKIPFVNFIKKYINGIFPPRKEIDRIIG